jgi:23S rRNA (uracil1939-C5)-methyltransferase
MMRLKGLKIARWAHGGDGVAVPTEGPLEGMVIFVKDAVPGDLVDVEIIQRKKRWARAVVKARVAASDERIEVACTIQAQCGGCPWMAGSAVAQAASRLAILTGEVRKRLRWGEAMIAARVGVAKDHGPSLGYRCRLRLGYDVRATGDVVLGFRAPRSHRLVDVTHCVVADAPLSAALPALRAALRDRGPGEGQVQLLSGQEGVGGWIRPSGAAAWGWGPQELTLQIGDVRMTATPRGFFQANMAVTEALNVAIAEAVGIPSASEAHAVELFAGSGTLTVGLLRAGYRVTAYELDSASEPLFVKNTAGEGRASFHVADLLETGVPFPAPDAPDLVVVDPPRQGALALMPWLRACGAERIVLVSCDVSTAIRDLSELTAQYEITQITGWNMFPHTGHQEVIALLQRNKLT